MRNLGSEQKPKKRARAESPHRNTHFPLPRDLPENLLLAPLSLENVWIMDEYDRWTRPPITFAAPETVHNQGKRILQKLAGRSSPIPSWPRGPELKNIRIVHDSTEHLQLKPDISDVLADLIRAGKAHAHMSITNFLLNGAADHVPVKTVLKSLAMSGDRYDPAKERKVIPLGALTIPASCDGLDGIDLLPKQVRVSKEIVYQEKIAEADESDKRSDPIPVPSWESCLVPTGCVTGPHTDYCGCSQLIQHIEGRKLWLCWPPTPHNLDIYLRQHLTGYLDFPTEAAIDQLECMELILLDSESKDPSQACFIMPGGTIHAVVTFSTSCHTGLKLWRLEDLKVAKLMNEIQLKVLYEREGLDGTTFKFYKDYFQDLKDELGNWDKLQRKSKRGNDRNELKEWIKTMRELKNID